MAKILGTNVAAAVVPFDTNDEFPTHYSEYGKGGWREVSTIGVRDAIPADRRNIGMAVYVISDDKTYILKGGFTNAHWALLTTEAQPQQTFVFTQTSASDSWVVNHNLGKYPSVTVVDSAGTTVIGDVQYLDKDNIVIRFSSPFTGIVYLN